MKKAFLFFVFLQVVFLSYSQINLQYKGKLKELLSILQHKYQYKFVYSNSEINDGQSISINLDNATIEVVMNQISKQTHISYKIIKRQIILIPVKKKNENPIDPIEKIQSGSSTPASYSIDELIRLSEHSSVSTPPHTVDSNVNRKASIQSEELKSDSIGQSTKQFSYNENKMLDSNHFKGIIPQKDHLEKRRKDQTEILDSTLSSEKIPPEKKTDSIFSTPKQSRVDSILTISDNSTSKMGKDIEQSEKDQLTNQTKQGVESNPSEEKPNGRENRTFVPKLPIAEFAIRNNLLSDLILTPNLGIECRIKKKWSFVLSGLWTHIRWGEGSKTYRIWDVSPEGRYYFSKNLYIGAMVHVGQVNLKLGKKGTQGDFMGAGITGGFVVLLSKHWALDFGVGFGCTNFKYDSYQYIESVNVRLNSEHKTFWVPTKASATLVFNL